MNLPLEPSYLYPFENLSEKPRFDQSGQPHIVKVRELLTEILDFARRPRTHNARSREPDHDSPLNVAEII
jgi:hypothetical protein